MKFNVKEKRGERKSVGEEVYFAIFRLWTNVYFLFYILHIHVKYKKRWVYARFSREYIDFRKSINIAYYYSIVTYKGYSAVIVSDTFRLVLFSTKAKSASNYITKLDDTVQYCMRNIYELTLSHYRVSLAQVYSPIWRHVMNASIFRLCLIRFSDVYCCVIRIVRVAAVLDASHIHSDKKERVRMECGEFIHSKRGWRI